MTQKLILNCSNQQLNMIFFLEEFNMTEVSLVLLLILNIIFNLLHGDQS